MIDMFKHYDETDPSYVPNNRHRFIPITEPDEIVVGASCDHVFTLHFSYTEKCSGLKIRYNQSLTNVLELTEADVLIRESNECNSTEIVVHLAPNKTTLFDPLKPTFTQIILYLKNGEVILGAENPIRVVRSLFTDETNVYNKLETLKAYTYYLEYDKIDYDYAMSYYKADVEAIKGGCSQVYANGLIGRNFDWKYNEDAQFVIKYKDTVGVAYKSGFTDADVLSRASTDIYKILPFAIVDGFNKSGLYVGCNVVPVQDNPAPTTIIGPEGKPELSTKMVVRWLLDHYTNALDAAVGIKNDIRIYVSSEMQKEHFEIHWFICDANYSYIVEMINNELVITEDNKMFNFYRHGITYNEDGSLYGPADVSDEIKPSVINGLGLHAVGVERSNIANTFISTIITKDDMMDLMANKLKYTNAYTSDNIWYSEFTNDEYSIDTPAAVYDPQVDAVRALFAERFPTYRDGLFWQTVHTCVYDLTNKKLYLRTQEQEDEFEVAL